ncbi:MAG TPA: flagellar hook-associated protein FlgK [Candidatus Acidoferrales bacterium]|nr:flagellar hook-associated protein FlgK [Candidatus Acidoferrales bacterium]
MGTLSSALNIAVGAMLADQAALDTTSNNIANANTPGYSRQTVNFEETPPVEYGGQLFGTGVEIGQITSQRNNVLQMSLDQATQQQSKYDSYLTSMQQVQTLFNETSGTGLQSSITAFFNSLQQLSTDPSNTSLRQAVLAAAQNMAQDFNSTSSSLTSLQQNVDQSVPQAVSQINSLTSQIAQLNSEVSAAESTGQNAGSLVDQRNQLISQVSGLIDVSQVDAGNGNVTLTTTSGAALVVGNKSFQLTTQANPTTGFQDVYSMGKDITSTINGGSLGGALQVRDSTIPSILSSLDSLATSLENSFNSVNKAGTDLNGNPGGNFFVPPPAGGAGAAATMSVALTDPSQIAASLDGSAGDNANVSAMLALQNQGIVNGQTPINAYSNLVFQVGNDVASAQSEEQGVTATVQQLQNQIGSISGVSINEEAANLVQYQQAYQAAAQVASVISNLTSTAINMVSTTQ